VVQAVLKPLGREVCSPKVVPFRRWEKAILAAAATNKSRCSREKRYNEGNENNLHGKLCGDI
jgi:hypothetical protein